MLATRVHSTMHKPQPLSSRKSEFRVRLTATNYRTGKMKWGLGKMGWFCMHLAFSSDIVSALTRNIAPYSLRDLLFHLSKSPFSQKNYCLEDDVCYTMDHQIPVGFINIVLIFSISLHHVQRWDVIVLNSYLINNEILTFKKKHFAFDFQKDEMFSYQSCFFIQPCYKFLNQLHYLIKCSLLSNCLII